MQKGLCLMKNKGVIEDIFPPKRALLLILLRIVKLNNGSTATFLQYVLSMAAGMAEARRRHMFFYGLL